MILYICYNNSCSEFPKEIIDNFPDLNIITYNENYYAEKKKAYKVKGGYSARMSPFMLLLNDDKSFVRAFYSENEGCNLESLKTCLSLI